MRDHHDREYVEYWGLVLQLRGTILPGHRTRQQDQSLLGLVETYYNTNQRQDFKGLLQGLVDDLGLHSCIDLDSLEEDQVMIVMHKIVDGVDIKHLEVTRDSQSPISSPETVVEKQDSPTTQSPPPTVALNKADWVFVCDRCNAYVRAANDFSQHQQYGTQRTGLKARFNLTTAEWYGTSDDGTRYQGRMQYFPGKNFPDWDSDFCERNLKIYLQQHENSGNRTAKPCNKKITKSRVNRGDTVELPT
ncbi:hypothetical protein LTR99_003278 [Exophiala xenobiotica]|uniref:Uncharacterized protein n=1 Tax=Vermiconidia calcicola TaxID=1690605 RepID=A0AAV9QEC4_9PEZI|nr:hypothetical protein LTR92_009456 [Exophiala xenobiotica]KAK5538945.1 hypothetical protein LTR25_004489 [Vermiconidia calcicola]KAK5540485.1 hypothetical protein LTR23_006167 [Chaetothyriales sp. CCFEE 6169]KAK5217884.1 hypothetical protein LTR72_009055 [Exophiala xenobiotica]KAK5266566.1 hypothetical protein LTR96_008413 [Exophiala xenobiotica]